MKIQRDDDGNYHVTDCPNEWARISKIERTIPSLGYRRGHWLVIAKQRSFINPGTVHRIFPTLREAKAALAEGI